MELVLGEMRSFFAQKISGLLGKWADYAQKQMVKEYLPSPQSSEYRLLVP
jgi:hypothetical protein